MSSNAQLMIYFIVNKIIIHTNSRLSKCVSQYLSTFLPSHSSSLAYISQSWNPCLLFKTQELSSPSSYKRIEKLIPWSKQKDSWISRTENKNEVKEVMVFEAYNEICNICNSYYSTSHVSTMLLASNPFVRLKSDTYDQKYNRTNIYS